MNAILEKLAEDGKIRKMGGGNKFKKNLKYYAQQNDNPNTLYQVLCNNSQWINDENELCFENNRQNFTYNITTTQDMNRKPITVWEIKNILGGRKSRKSKSSANQESREKASPADPDIKLSHNCICVIIRK